jgi:hypothetical protein
VPSPPLSHIFSNGIESFRHFGQIICEVSLTNLNPDYNCICLVISFLHISTHYSQTSLCIIYSPDKTSRYYASDPAGTGQMEPLCCGRRNATRDY